MVDGDNGKVENNNDNNKSLTKAKLISLRFSQAYFEMSQFLGIRRLYETVQGTTNLSQEYAWLFGKRYGVYNEEVNDFRLTNESMLELNEDFKKLVWFTYRRDFEPLGTEQITSDVHWGCTFRSGQMMLAEAIRRIHSEAESPNTSTSRKINSVHSPIKSSEIRTGVFKEDLVSSCSSSNLPQINPSTPSPAGFTAMATTRVLQAKQALLATASAATAVAAVATSGLAFRMKSGGGLFNDGDIGNKSDSANDWGNDSANISDFSSHVTDNDKNSSCCCDFNSSGGNSSNGSSTSDDKNPIDGDDKHYTNETNAPTSTVSPLQNVNENTDLGSSVESDFGHGSHGDLVNVAHPITSSSNDCDTFELDNVTSNNNYNDSNIINMNNGHNNKNGLNHNNNDQRNSDSDNSDESVISNAALSEVVLHHHSSFHNGSLSLPECKAISVTTSSSFTSPSSSSSPSSPSSPSSSPSSPSSSPSPLTSSRTSSSSLPSCPSSPKASLSESNSGSILELSETKSDFNFRKEWTVEDERTLISLFLDCKSAPFSLHRLCCLDPSLGVLPGLWLGPWGFCSALAHLPPLGPPFFSSSASSAPPNLNLNLNQNQNQNHPSERVDGLFRLPFHQRLLRVHVCEPQGGVPTLRAPVLLDALKMSDVLSSPPLLPDCSSSSSSSPHRSFSWPRAKNALLILVPLTLGIDQVTSVYIPQLQEVLRMPQSVGVVGGKPGSSLYVVGTQGKN
eukprot:CAMPEP_0175069504 /NCGR_PEP_ID=MMETSP0052_2-20121109/18228_1 /TAXON_ID=51329 ORGANISM="Polytomella parva, Strain SAG 63-3" /NCGR_SAMPLE_ID=MMETSP0052_2 /ASSEMBLY_ACC=CAM_ASM_000194 /LENGTH=733 /DNA_ID=CAMNT_0016336579 /DNA_START=55 /DNA_END=2253 /DNA_ORIENTATION=-